MKSSTSNTIVARTLIILLMAITLLPFLSMLSAALAPQGTSGAAHSQRVLTHSAPAWHARSHAPQ